MVFKGIKDADISIDPFAEESGSSTSVARDLRLAYIWNALATSAFLILAFFSFRYIAANVGFATLGSISIEEILLMALATYRIVRLVTYDKITVFARDLFLDVHIHNGEPVRTKPAWGFRREVAELLECTWCTGVWAASFVVFIYLLSDIGRVAVIVLAVSALGTAMQLIVKRYVSGSEH